MATTTAATTVPVESLADFASPTEELQSFSFRLSMLNSEEDFGIVAEGDFVAPDGVTCDVWNPGLVGSHLGVGTAIATDFWFDDGFFEPTAEPRDSASAQEWGSFCPGFDVYWVEPIFLDTRMSVAAIEPGETISELPTTAFMLEGSTDLEIDRGTVWLTNDGWPIRYELIGSTQGGVFSFFDLELDEADLEDTPFVIEMVLTAVNGAQIVRSPDGAIQVGPHGEAAATIQALPEPSADLRAAIDYADGSSCVEDWTMRWTTQGANLESLGLAQIWTWESWNEQDTKIKNILPGMSEAGLGWQAFTDADDDNLARIHAELLFNHRAPLMALFTWLQTAPAPMKKNDQLDLSMDSDVNQTSVIASWNGETVTFEDGSTADQHWSNYLATPHPDVAVDDATYAEAQAWLAEWVATVTPVAEDLSDIDMQAVANLEALSMELDETKAVACIVLASAWQKAEEAINTNQDPTIHYPDEIAAQHALLSIEYLEMLSNHLSRARIDWLRGDNLNLSTNRTEIDTTGWVMWFIADILKESLYLSNPGAY